MARADVFLLVSLREPERDVASYVTQAVESDPREWLKGLRRAFSTRERRVLAESELELARVKADQVHARLADFLPVRPARGVGVAMADPTVHSVAAWVSPRSMVYTSRGHWPSKATVRPCWRRSRAMSCAGWTATSSTNAGI